VTSPVDAAPTPKAVLVLHRAENGPCHRKAPQAVLTAPVDEAA
jgi:hypothetical protein